MTNQLAARWALPNAGKWLGFQINLILILEFHFGNFQGGVLANVVRDGSHYLRETRKNTNAKLGAEEKKHTNKWGKCSPSLD